MAIINLGKIGILPRGEWLPEISDYSFLDLVSFEGGSYLVHIRTDTVPAGTLPTDTTYFQVIALRGEQGLPGGETLNTPVLSLGTVGFNAIQLLWNAVPNGENYTVQRAMNSSFTDETLVYTGSNLGYNDIGLSDKTQYYYRIKATAAGYNDSFFGTISATTLEGTLLTLTINIDGLSEDPNILINGQLQSKNALTFYSGTVLNNIVPSVDGYDIIPANISSIILNQNEILNFTATSQATPRVPTPQIQFSSITQTSLTVNWNKPIGAEIFEVQRAANSGFTNGLETIYIGPLQVFNDTELMASNTYYYRIKASGVGYDDSAYAVGLASTMNFVPEPPTIVADDENNTISASHILGDSEIVVSINNDYYIPYFGVINVGIDARPEGYYKFKIKAATGRAESSVVRSPAFTWSYLLLPGASKVEFPAEDYIDLGFGYLPKNGDLYRSSIGKQLIGDGMFAVKYDASSSKQFGISLQNTNGEYVGISIEKDSKITTAKQSNQTVAILPNPPDGDFICLRRINNIISIVYTPDGLSFDTIHAFGSLSDYETIFIEVDSKAATQTDAQNAIVYPQGVNILERSEPPNLTVDFILNTISASHILGDSEILVSENDGPYIAYTGIINVGEVDKAEGYWKFKARATAGKLESVVIKSPKFPLERYMDGFIPITLTSIDTNFIEIASGIYTTTGGPAAGGSYAAHAILGIPVGGEIAVKLTEEPADFIFAVKRTASIIIDVDPLYYSLYGLEMSASGFSIKNAGNITNVLTSGYLNKWGIVQRDTLGHISIYLSDGTTRTLLGGVNISQYEDSPIIYTLTWVQKDRIITYPQGKNLVIP